MSSCQPCFHCLLFSGRWAELGHRWDGGKRPPKRGPTRRTSKKASLKTPGRLYRVSPCARVELGWTRGRFLELVGQDSQEEFRAGEPRTPADQTLLSGRGRYSAACGGGLSSHPNLRVRPPLPPNPLTTLQSQTWRETHRKLGAAHSCQGPGGRGWGSEDLVEPAGHGLAGGASLRARLLMSPWDSGTSLGRMHTRTRPVS